MEADNITDDEIDETMDLINLISDSPFFAHDLQIRDSERGLGLVFADGDGECWAITPDPFYTKAFLSTLKAQCNMVRRARLAVGQV